MESLDVVGIGNAIVDVVAEADDGLLAEEGLPKGSMTLIDAARADALRARMGPAVEVCGGSAANTMVGVARLGGAAGYVGKVRDDEAGGVFTRDIRGAGVAFSTPAAAEGAATARCLIFVTPDAQRTMNTHLGACVELGPGDIDPDFIASARLLYMEGYLWDPPAAKEAFRKALAITRQARGRVCLSLSDSFCVDRHREELRDLVANDIDVLVRQRRRGDGALRGAGLRRGACCRPRGLRRRRADAERPGLGGGGRWRGPYRRGGAHRPAGGYHRRGRPLRRRLPAQASRGASTSPAAAASPRSPPARFWATTAPAPRPTSPPSSTRAGTPFSPHHGAVHSAHRARQDCAMQRAIHLSAAHVSAATCSRESRLSHLIPLYPGESRQQLIVAEVGRGTGRRPRHDRRAMRPWAGPRS